MNQRSIVVGEEKTPFRDRWISQLREAGFRAVPYERHAAAGQLRSTALFLAGTGCGQPLLFQLRSQGIPVIFIAHASSEQQAIDALRAGCVEYLRMPLEAAELIAAVSRLVEKPSSADDDGIVGDSQSVRELRGLLARVARVKSNVLITGETGTGKELVARAIHRLSDRADQRLVCVNCAAIPDSLVESELFGYERGAFTGAVTAHAGKLQAAEAGTIFLDEIGDMSLTAQAKILRAIETRELYRLGGYVAIPLNVRILVATHRNLEQMVSDGQFRSDLLYRLSVTRVHMPPLRARRQDIKPIVRSCLQELNRELHTEVETVSDEVWELLLNYSWPGNIRELKHMMEAILVQSPSKTITLDDIPLELRAKLADGCRRDERDRILSALMETKWNKSKAAEKLRWSRMTLYRKMTKYSVHTSSWSPSSGNPIV